MTLKCDFLDMTRTQTLCRGSNLSAFSPCLIGSVDYPFASRHKGPGFKTPGGYLCETRILLLALSLYIGDPDVIDHFCGLIWGGLCPELSLGPHADNVIIPLDLTQLFCPCFTLAARPPSSFTTDIVGCWGEPCGEPAISLHSHQVSLVQWTTRLLLVTRDPGSKPQGGYFCEMGILLLALSCYNMNINMKMNMKINTTWTWKCTWTWHDCEHDHEHLHIQS